MKLARLLLIFVFALAAAGFSSGKVSAEKFTYTSGFQVQNLANADATVTITYFNQQTADSLSGGEATSTTVTIPSLSSSTFYPIHASAGFKGSVVLSSDQPLAAITNLIASLGGAVAGNDSYVGLATGGTEVSLPWLAKNNYGYDSYFSVQNTGAADATVSVAYSDGTSAGPVTVKPSASYVFKQADETHTPKVFAGKITSDQPVIAVVVQEAQSTGFTAISAYNGFITADTSALMPLINENNYGFVTGIQVQNGGSASSDITISYTPTVVNSVAIGSACTETQTIAAGASKTFGLYAFVYTPTAGVTTNCVKGQRFVGSAKITGNTGSVAVQAIINQATAKSTGAYDSFAPSAATATVVLPLIMDRNYGWYTGFNLQNVGDVEVSYTCAFSNSAYSLSGTLAAGASVNDVQNNKIANRYAGSATCTATAGSGTPKIAVVVNEISPDAADNLLVYGGINIP